jgi:hypothetical protein
MAKDPVCNMIVDENKVQHFSSQWEESISVFSILQKSFRSNSSEIQILDDSTEALPIGHDVLEIETVVIIFLPCAFF